ncbi:MAG: D-glycerate dehydrogenase [Gemmatimonadota bacterium]
MPPTVTVTRKLPPAVEAALTAEFDARLNPDDRPMGAAALRAAFEESDAVLPTVSDRIGADLFGPPLRARLIANFGVGTDHIDLDAAVAAGLVVTNTPGVLTDCTADLTMALLLAVMRRLGEAERELRGGAWTGWRPTHMLGTRVTGKTLGIVGFGRIGRAVARRAHHGFGMRILFHTPETPPPEECAGLGAEPRESLDAMLEECDVVSIHCPATPETRHLIDAVRLARMKPDSFLVNTARGDIVDEVALVAALKAGRLAGAGLDVYEREPAVSAGLLELGNVVLLPHIGSASVETRTDMGMRALDNLRAFFAGQEPPDRI